MRSSASLPLLVFLALSLSAFGHCRGADRPSTAQDSPEPAAESEVADEAVEQGSVKTPAEGPAGEASPAAQAVERQLAALGRGDVGAALAPLAGVQVFAGPRSGQVASDEAARELATEFLGELAAAGFPYELTERHEGGAELSGTRWLVHWLRHGGENWIVSSLLVDSGGWSVAAQTWDVVEPDSVVLSLAQEGLMAPPVALPEDSGPGTEGLVEWITATHVDPGSLNFPEPLRSDTFTLGSAGEFAEGDAALAELMQQHATALQSGALVVRVRPGFVARAIGELGVVVTGLDLTFQQEGEPVTIPLRGTVFALLGEAGPRYVGAHYVASP